MSKGLIVQVTNIVRVTVMIDITEKQLLVKKIQKGFLKLFEDFDKRTQTLLY